MRWKHGLHNKLSPGGIEIAQEARKVSHIILFSQRLIASDDACRQIAKSFPKSETADMVPSIDIHFAMGNSPLLHLVAPSQQTKACLLLYHHDHQARSEIESK